MKLKIILSVNLIIIQKENDIYVYNTLYNYKSYYVHFILI